MKITFVLELVEVRGERRWKLWLRLRDACACGAWLTVQGLSPFHPCLFAQCISISTIVRAEKCLFLTGKPGLAAWSKGEHVWNWAAAGEERKFPKGVKIVGLANWHLEYEGSWTEEEHMIESWCQFLVDKIWAVLMITQVWAVTEKKVWLY